MSMANFDHDFALGLGYLCEFVIGMWLGSVLNLDWAIDAIVWLLKTIFFLHGKG